MKTPVYLMIVVVSALLVVSAVVPFAASADSYEGPSITVTPSNISPGGVVDINLAVQTVSTLPSGPGNINQSYCQLSSQTFQNYQIVEVSVTTPSGDAYQIGDSSGSGFTGYGGSATPLTLLSTNSFTIPFGPESGPLTIAGNNYYWWRNQIAGVGTPAPGQRLDQYPGSSTGPFSNSNPPAPTIESGTYTIDLSGITTCLNGQTGSFQATLWFDLPFFVITPQFGLGVGLAGVAAVSLLGMMLLRRRTFGKFPTI